MTFRGLLNCDLDYRSPWFDPATIGAVGTTAQQIYTTVMKFLSGSAGQSLGIRLRAHHYGRNNEQLFNYGWRSGGSSSMDYWDEEAPGGQNAFSVFEFTNASPPLWVCIQFHGYSFNSGLNPGSFPTSPTINQDFFSSEGATISCAFMKNGTSPWNGTSANTGSDTKGSPCWRSGAVIFPRASGDGGSREDLADGVMNLSAPMDYIRGVTGTGFGSGFFNPTASFDKNSGIYHVIASESSLMVFLDPNGIGNYYMFYVGKYDPIRTALSESLNWANYVCLQLANFTNASNRPILPRHGEALSPFGPRTHTTLAYNFSSSAAPGDQGGNFGTYIAGGINNVYANKVQSVIIDRNQLIEDTNLQTPIYLRHPNRAASDPTGRVPGKFDLFTIPLACFEEHFAFGKVGEISDFYMVFGLPSNTTLNNKSLAVVGDSQMNTIKLAIPWDGVSDPGTAGGRGGIPF